MAVIEVEGTNSEPLLIDSLHIFAGARELIQVSCNAYLCYIGQRYSVVVCPSYFRTIGGYISTACRSTPANL